ncbi:tRNA dihydrouridine synthase B [Clostridiaceae bacterium JG1575]|nr:tRNA dihydrouridine synthase B [Clostridiaceae bacterium JG1575]
MISPIQLTPTKVIGPILMAPLAGVTDRAYRGILTTMGADLTYTEMVSAKALTMNSKKTKTLLRLAPEQQEVAVQLFGRDPLVLAKIAETFNDDPSVVLIDINMGCPAPKIVKNGEGAALMREPHQAARILQEVRRASSKPVTCKFRRGFALGEETAVDFALLMEEAGACMVTVHGRYRDQFYAGVSDRGIIKKVREAVSIPVVANGDIFSALDAQSLWQKTGAAGIMVARGALGNPWIFQQIKARLRGEPEQRPTVQERLDLARRHLAGLMEDLPEPVAVREMRKHFAWYLKGLPFACKTKEAINAALTQEEVWAILAAFQEQLQAQGPLD